jgi:hypothetical protein
VRSRGRRARSEHGARTATWARHTEGSRGPLSYRALAVHRELALRSQHRHFRLPDLVIAATAELSGATVLHYDAAYDRIRAVTDQPTEWVAPRGEL